MSSLSQRGLLSEGFRDLVRAAAKGAVKSTLKAASPTLYGAAAEKIGQGARELLNPEDYIFQIAKENPERFRTPKITGKSEENGVYSIEFIITIVDIQGEQPVKSRFKKKLDGPGYIHIDTVGTSDDKDIADSVSSAFGKLRDKKKKGPSSKNKKKGEAPSAEGKAPSAEGDSGVERSRQGLSGMKDTLGGLPQKGDPFPGEEDLGEPEPEIQDDDSWFDDQPDPTPEEAVAADEWIDTQPEQEPELEPEQEEPELDSEERSWFDATEVADEPAEVETEDDLIAYQARIDKIAAGEDPDADPDDDDTLPKPVSSGREKLNRWKNDHKDLLDRSRSSNVIPNRRRKV